MGGSSGQPLGRLEPLLIISGMFPPMRGGLPDHTDRLAHVLARTRRVTVLTSRGVETDRPFRVLGEVTNWHDRGRLLGLTKDAAMNGPILWQYVPHMYGRGGVNFSVPAVMGGLALEGFRQVVLAHEIRAPFSFWPHRSGYALAHRFMWRRVRAAADAIGISTGGWLDRLRETDPARDRLFLAPSPSNIPVVPLPSGHREAWRARHGLEGVRRLMGFFGSVGTGKQFEWVLAAWREARRKESATGLAVIGGRPEPGLTEEERRLFRPLGYLGGEEASAALQALDLLVLPFEDGVSERRSSFMVGLAHGLAVVTTVGEGTGRDLREGGFYCGVPVGEGAAAFGRVAGEWMEDEAGRRSLGEKAVARYGALYDWECLALEVSRRWEKPGEGHRLEQSSRV